MIFHENRLLVKYHTCTLYFRKLGVIGLLIVKGIYFVIFGIISKFTDKGQSNLKGPQEGTYLYTTQFLSLR